MPDEFRRHYVTAAECLYDAYDEVSRGITDDIADAFARSPSWSEAVTNATESVLRRLTQRPAEAQLCFIEAPRGDRELLRRREATRRRMVELVAAEHRRRSDCEELSEIQSELLVGAGFQVFAAHVRQGRIEEVPELAAELVGLVDVFEPVAA